MDLAGRIIATVGSHPAVRSIELVGSRAEGRAGELSDWDFKVDASDFATLSEALPALSAPFDPLAQQWDRLSSEQCWMLVLRGPAKVDLIFPVEPHVDEPPWEPGTQNLDAIDAHFWDWMLWLVSKQATGQADLRGGRTREAVRTSARASWRRSRSGVDRGGCGRLPERARPG
jgi:hypothetical protein